jgi:hypothetical protein
MYQKFGYASARKDMENKQKPEKILYLTERPNYPQEFEAWSRLSDEVFGRGKNAPEKK